MCRCARSSVMGAHLLDKIRAARVELICRNCGVDYVRELRERGEIAECGRFRSQAVRPSLLVTVVFMSRGARQKPEQRQSAS